MTTFLPYVAVCPGQWCSWTIWHPWHPGRVCLMKGPVRRCWSWTHYWTSLDPELWSVKERRERWRLHICSADVNHWVQRRLYKEALGGAGITWSWQGAAQTRFEKKPDTFVYCLLQPFKCENTRLTGCVISNPRFPARVLKEIKTIREGEAGVGWEGE